MKRVWALFLVLICMLSLVACDKATGSGEPVRGGDASDMPVPNVSMIANL